MLANGRAISDEGIWEKFSLRLKEWTFSLIHNLLETQTNSSFLYNILVLVETIQLAYFSIHPSIKNLFTSSYLGYFSNIVRYFQMDYILKNGNTTILYSAQIAVMVIVFLIFVLSIAITIKIQFSKKKSSAFLTYTLKILSFIVLLILTIFTMPMFQILIAPLMCINTNPVLSGEACFGGAHIVFFILSIVFLVMFIFELVMFSLLFLDINPNSKIPFAGPQNRISLIRIVFKMIVSAVFMVDFEGSFSIYSIGVLTFFYLLFLMIRYRSILYYNKMISSFTCICDVSLFWATLCVLTQIVFNDGDSDIGLIYMLIEIPFAAYSFLFLIDQRKFGMVKANLKKLKKAEDVETYFNIIRDLIEMRESDSHRIKLEGMLKYHTKSCSRSNDDCPCTFLSMEMTREEDGSQKISKWYLLLRSILLEALEKFSKSPRLHLLNAYLQHEKLNNKYKALFELMDTKENKPNLQEDFAIFRYKLIIEDEMIEADIRNSDSIGINVNQMVKFQNRYVGFVSTIESAVRLHGDFWRELTEDNPDIKKLQNLGSMITNIIEDCKRQFDKLNDINPNHSRLLETYGWFLKDVVNNENDGQRVLDRSQKLNKSVNRSIDENANTKFEESAGTSIITISGNYKLMGTIINVNNGIRNLLGYKPQEVIGEKVDMIMPKIFADSHPKLLMKYFNDSAERPLNIERTVYAMNKKGYIIPCTLLAKILPSLEKGIQIVGFLKRIENTGESHGSTHYILYSAEDGILYGVTKSCYDHFGIRSSLTFGKCYNMSELKMEMICPNLMDPANSADLKSSNGLIVDIDTTPIQANHPLENENDESIDDAKIVENEEKEVNLQIQKLKRYKKYKIRAKLHYVYNLLGGDLKMNVLKFDEVRGEDAPSDESNSDEFNRSSQEDLDVKEHVEHFEQDIRDDSEDVNASNAEGGDNDNEKQLKEAKAQISEKNVPKSIRRLNYIFMCFLVMLLIVYGGIAAALFYKSSSLTSSVEGLIVTSSRHSTLAETNFYCRKLNLAANQFLLYSDSQTDAQTEDLITQVKAIISEKASEIQKIEFDAFKVEGALKTALGRNISSDNIEVVKKLSNDQISVFEDKFDGAIFNYIADTYQLTGTTTENLKNIEKDETGVSTERENAASAFFLIRENGLNSLRSGSENITNVIYEFYLGQFDLYIYILIGILAAGVLFTCIGILVLIPTVFKVLKTSKMVMALFGKIKKDDIRELAEKCDVYIRDILNEQKKELKVNKSYLQKKEQQNVEEGGNASPEESHMLQAEEDDVDNEDFDNRTQKPINGGGLDDMLSSDNNGGNVENQLIKKNESESSKAGSKIGSGFSKMADKSGKKGKKVNKTKHEPLLEKVVEKPDEEIE